MDEWLLRETAYALAKSYKQLRVLHDTRPRPAEVRTLKPTPGPREPGNALVLAALIDNEVRLREVAFEALAEVGVKLKDGDGRAYRLCELIGYYANSIAELDWSDDLHDELKAQHHRLSRVIDLVQPIADRPADLRRVERHLLSKYGGLDKRG